MKCTHRDGTTYCQAVAVVEMKSTDPEDSSGGRFCMDHARTFLNAPTVAEWLAVIEPDATVSRRRLSIALEILEGIEGNDQVDLAQGYLSDLLADLPPEVPAEPLKLAVNLAQKIGLPDYSSAEMSMHVSGITAETSDAEVEATIERGRLVYTQMGNRLAELAKQARRNGGW